MLISVILPTYEQPRSVRCALAALENQTFDPGYEPGRKSEFEVLVIDDSASDVVQEVVWPPALNYRNLPLYYIRSSPPRVGRFTASRARNIGAANARGELLVFIDQDVMLGQSALEKFAEAYRMHGDNTVILGLYHWLPRINFDYKDVRANLTAIYEAGLDLVPEPAFERLPMDEPGPIGWDLRTDDFGTIENVVDDAALGCFSGNIGYPRELFMRLGGFDEEIRGHGGEDADLGLTAKEAGARFCLYGDIWGLHRWHGRDQKQNAEDVQKNIDYIDRKHGIGQYADAAKWMDARDWNDKQHFQKEVGGVLMKIETDPTYWACRDGHRMGIPSIQVLTSLGFRPEEVVLVPASALAEYEVHGWPQ